MKRQLNFDVQIKHQVKHMCRLVLIARAGLFGAALALVAATVACMPKPPLNEQGEENARTQMFLTALSDINQVYLQTPNLPALGIAGLKGLRQIEPGLYVEARDQSLDVSIGAATVMSTQTPETVDGWARLFSEALEKAATVSPAIETASDETIFTAIFTNLTRELDPYSRYASAETAAVNRIKRRGYGGIGVTLRAHPRGAKIIKVQPNLPASQVKLGPGDVIIGVGDTLIQGMSIKQVHALIRGPINVPVSLKFFSKCASSPVRVLLNRARIAEKTIHATYHKGIAVFRINGFNRDTTNALAKAVAQAKRRNGKKLQGAVLDLRNNPGGLLNQAVAVADLFLDQGHIISTRGRHKNSMQKFDAKPGDILNGLPVAVLINGTTASAAEILAAALQDNGRAVVIGSSSFGKGTVQTVLGMPNDGEFIITWALFQAPSGYAIQELGVFPTVCTVGQSNAFSIIKQFNKTGIGQSRAQLKLRRSADFRDAKQPGRIRKKCLWQPNRDIGLDRRVADLMLKAQDRYARAANLARMPPGS